jgi:hypothetical protein
MQGIKVLGTKTAGEYSRSFKADRILSNLVMISACLSCEFCLNMVT